MRYFLFIAGFPLRLFSAAMVLVIQSLLTPDDYEDVWEFTKDVFWGRI
jgi:hypothetical protein